MSLAAPNNVQCLTFGGITAAMSRGFRIIMATNPPQRAFSWSSDSTLMPRECVGNSALPAILGGDYWRELLVISVARGFYRELIEFHRFLAGNVFGIAPMTLH